MHWTCVQTEDGSKLLVNYQYAHNATLNTNYHWVSLIERLTSSCASSTVGPSNAPSLQLHHHQPLGCSFPKPLAKVILFYKCCCRTPEDASRGFFCSVNTIKQTRLGSYWPIVMIAISATVLHVPNSISIRQENEVDSPTILFPYIGLDWTSLSAVKSSMSYLYVLYGESHQ